MLMYEDLCLDPSIREALQPQGLVLTNLGPGSTRDFVSEEQGGK